MTYFKLIPALLLSLPACVLDKGLGDTSAASSTTTGDNDTTGPGDDGTTDPTSTTIDTTGPGDGTTDPTPTTGGPAPLCPNSASFSCTVPFKCTDFPCGGLADLFDADGCPRSRCSEDAPCPAGQVCYDTGDWGSCNASGVSCEDQGDTCLCGQTADCQDVAYCVPAEIGPPADCFAITDEGACMAAGCWEEPGATPVTVDGDTCVCGELEIACLWFPEEDVGLEGSPGTFYEIASGRVVSFPFSWITLPHGWADCEDGQGPPACACAETCEG